MGITKAKIIELIKSINLPSDSFWVIMGAALVLYGFKETTNDIDIGCTQQLFNLLLSTGFTQQQSHEGIPKISYSDLITLYCEWPTSYIVTVNQIRVSSIQDIIADKRRLGRKKDLDDIQLIQNAITEKKVYVHYD